MADDSLAEHIVKRHPLAGRKQTAEHIQKRTASCARTRASWSEERIAKWRKTASENARSAWNTLEQRANTPSKMAESVNKTCNKSTIIYGLADCETGCIRYIGKTSASLRKRYRQHRCDVRRGSKIRLYNWWRSLSLEPDIFEIETVEPGGDWVESEQFWISYFRFIGCDLVNRCDGGQGTAGIKFTDEHCAKISKAHLGRKVPPERLEKLRLARLKANAARRGVRWKPGQKEKMLATRFANHAAGLHKKRRPATDETKAKISAAKRGIKLTAEHRAKLSAVRKGKQIGRVFSDAAREKMSKSHKGKPLSEAHRAALAAANRANAGRISKSLREYYARKRASAS